MPEIRGYVMRMLITIARKYLPCFVAGIVFAIVCFVGLNAAMKPVSTSEYCGSNCHEMSTAYQSWELSSHGSNTRGITVNCVDCHLPSKDNYFTYMFAKARDGAKDVLMHHFGPEYDLEKIRSRVRDEIPNQRCLNCHDNLLARPVKSASRIAHRQVLNNPDRQQSRCVNCHENAGHERHSKIFTE